MVYPVSRTLVRGLSRQLKLGLHFRKLTFDGCLSPIIPSETNIPYLQLQSKEFIQYLLDLIEILFIQPEWSRKLGNQLTSRLNPSYDSLNGSFFMSKRS